MSTLKIVYPHIPAEAYTATPNHAYSADHRLINASRGKRSTIAHLAATTAATHQIAYDLGAGNTASADHLMIARADLLKWDGCTDVWLKGSNTNYAGATTVFHSSTVAADLAYNNDLIYTFAASTAYRYWWLEFAGGDVYPRSKNHFGTFWDAGVDPSGFDYAIAGATDSAVVLSTGRVRLSRAIAPRYAFGIQWDGVSDAAATAFFETVLNDETKHDCWLYAPTVTQILADNVLVPVRVLADQCKIIRNKAEGWNTINAYFEQVP
jgi:hypothetical protein